MMWASLLGSSRIGFSLEHRRVSPIAEMATRRLKESLLLRAAAAGDTWSRLGLSTLKWLQRRSGALRRVAGSSLTVIGRMLWRALSSLLLLLLLATPSSTTPCDVGTKMHLQMSKSLARSLRLKPGSFATSWHRMAFWESQALIRGSVLLMPSSSCSLVLSRTKSIGLVSCSSLAVSVWVLSEARQVHGRLHLPCSSGPCLYGCSDICALLSMLPVVVSGVVILTAKPSPSMTSRSPRQ
mmetsp:Transcript_6537/g.19164  ORF Transcript_6537/g.19164 Transcript_6537/m.19164 type:complete len:239 (+) Transcript_6537:474-1190(+)